jgi:hypothetical protein
MGEINIPKVPEVANLACTCISDEHGTFLCRSCTGPKLRGSPLPRLGDRPAVQNTTVDVKRQYFDKFAGLIRNQFNHGGDKYVLPGLSDREATDVISAVFGGESQFEWVLGTIVKYVFRFRSFQREKDLLKIATYCYILWLKQGNHLKETNDEDVSREGK